MPSEVLNFTSRSKCFLIPVVPQKFRGVFLGRSFLKNMLCSVCGLFVFMAFWAGLSMDVSAAPGIENDGIQIVSAEADNESRVIQGDSVDLGSHPTLVTFRFLPRTNNLSSAM